MHRDGVRLKESHCEIEGYTLPECFKQVSVLTFIFAFFGHLKSIMLVVQLVEGNVSRTYIGY